MNAALLTLDSGGDENGIGGESFAELGFSLTNAVGSLEQDIFPY